MERVRVRGHREIQDERLVLESWRAAAVRAHEEHGVGEEAEHLGHLRAVAAG